MNSFQKEIFGGRSNVPMHKLFVDVFFNGITYLDPNIYYVNTIRRMY